MYEILYKNLIQTDADISICRFDRIDENHPTLTERGNSITELSQTEALSRLFTYSCLDFTIAWNKLYKRDLFDKIRYPKGRIREDEFTTYKLIYSSKKIVLTEQSLYFYVQSPNSIMRNGDFRKETDYADAMEERIAFFKENRLYDFYITAIKQYCLWLISLNYTNKKYLKQNQQIKSNFSHRLRSYTGLLQHDYKLPLFSRLVYIANASNPFLTGILATQRFYGYNFASSLMDWLFDEQNRFKYTPNKGEIRHK